MCDRRAPSIASRESRVRPSTHLGISASFPPAAMLPTLLAALFATQVPEPPRGDALVWDAPPGCPDRLALTDAIAARLGRAPAPDELTLVGRIAQDGAARYHLELRLTVDGHTQTRRLTTRRCAALIDAAALLVRLALDPAATDAAPESLLTLDVAPEDGDPPPDAPASPATSDPPRPAPAPAPTGPTAQPDPLPPTPAPPEPRRRIGGLVRVSGGLELGALPAPTAGIALAAGVLWPRARLEFHGAYLVRQTAARDANAVTVDLLAAGARGCARPGRGAFEFPLCGGLELGALRGQGQGPGARRATGLWAAAFASVGAVWRVQRRLGLGLEVQGLGRLAAPSFDLRDDPDPPATLFTSAPVGLRVLLGLEVRLGDIP